MNQKSYIISVFFKWTFLVSVFLGSINITTAQKVLSDTTKTNGTEVATNIDLVISFDQKKKLMNVMINNQNTGATCIGGELFIYNDLGETVYQSAVNTTSVGVDISSLKPGIYFVQFNFQEKRVKKKIMIE